MHGFHGGRWQHGPEKVEDFENWSMARRVRCARCGWLAQHGPQREVAQTSVAHTGINLFAYDAAGRLTGQSDPRTGLISETVYSPTNCQVVSERAAGSAVLEGIGRFTFDICTFKLQFSAIDQCPGFSLAHSPAHELFDQG